MKKLDFLIEKYQRDVDYLNSIKRTSYGDDDLRQYQTILNELLELKQSGGARSLLEEVRHTPIKEIRALGIEGMENLLLELSREYKQYLSTVHWIEGCIMFEKKGIDQ